MMKTAVEQKLSTYRPIRSLFIIGLVTLIMAASGVTWLLVEFAQVDQRAALYNGSWVDPSSFIISKLQINSTALKITVHVSGNCGAYAYLSCDMGTYTQTFKEPIIIYLDSSISTGLESSEPLVITLSNTGNTKLQVTINNESNLFDKK